jgi:hypothetical protein
MIGTGFASFLRRNAIGLAALFVALGGIAYAGALAPNNSVDSSAIINGQVKSKDIADSAVPRARFDATGICNPGLVSDITCASLEMKLPRRGRVLLVVGGSWHETGTADGSVLGHCFIFADDVLVWSASYGQKTATFEDGSGGGSPYSGTVAMTNVTGVLAKGQHTFRVDCRENEADITFVTGLSAVALGST